MIVLSDGTQHVRALVEGERITLHVNDWYGGTNVGLWEWITNYGKGKTIASGEVIQTHVHLRFVDAETLDALF
ncbi:MAG: hypothetical protein ABIL68_04615 [bacterium]